MQDNSSNFEYAEFDEATGWNWSDSDEDTLYNNFANGLYD